ncbi:hypothetical protein ANCDUO_11499, partial [Ancylostoma duodenale]
WCGDVADNLTVWTDNPNVWRCELPSAKVGYCSDVAFITCLRLDDLGGDLYLMLFNDSPDRIGIDPDYLAKGRVDKLQIMLKCRDGKWTLPDSSIRLTHILCDQYIIDKKKAADSPFKPVGSLANISTTTLSVVTSPELASSTDVSSTSTMSDFDDNDVEVKNPDVTEEVVDNFHETTTEDAMSSPQITDETTTTTQQPRSSDSVADSDLSTKTSQKTKQVLVQAMSHVTTTPMTTASTSSEAFQPVTSMEEDLLTTAEQQAEVSTVGTADTAKVDDVHPTETSTDSPNESSTTEPTTPAELDVAFMDLLNDIPIRTPPPIPIDTTSFSGSTTTKQSRMEIRGDEIDPGLPNPPSHVDPYDGAVLFPESEMKAQKAPSPVKPRKQLKQVTIPNRRIGQIEKHSLPEKSTVVRARPLATGRRRRLYKIQF